MPYTHSNEKATKFATQAFERMQKGGLTPTPDMFELWYVFYSAENPEICHAIEVIEDGGEDITHEMCAELHQRFLSDDTGRDHVRQAGDKIQLTIMDVNNAVSSVKDATSKYSETLTDVKSKLGDDISKDEMAVVLKDVMDNTEDMVQHNLDLEEKLAQSSEVMQELQRDLEIVRKEALTDGLTSLANRKAFDAEISRIAMESDAEGQTFCLLMLDIDHFKSFNDNYGHQVGDQVLRLVAGTLIDGVKGRDIASRFGGEEFAIILPETNLNGGVNVGDLLRKAVASKEVVNRNSGDVLGRITMSGGVAQYMPGENIEDLIERADAALYTAKNNGRNKIAAAPTSGQEKEAG